MSEPTEVYYRTDFDAGPGSRIEVYGSGEDGGHEWRLVRAGLIEHDTVL